MKLLMQRRKKITHHDKEDEFHGPRKWEKQDETCLRISSDASLVSGKKSSIAVVLQHLVSLEVIATMRWKAHSAFSINDLETFGVLASLLLHYLMCAASVTDKQHLLPRIRTLYYMVFFISREPTDFKWCKWCNSATP